MSEYKDGHGDYYLGEGLRDQNARLQTEVEQLRAAIAHAGLEYRDPCDACGDKPDPREPDVICAWCDGVGKRLIVRAKVTP